MSTMRVAIGTDHRANAAGAALVDGLRTKGCEVRVLCDLSCERADYPDSAYMVAAAVAAGEAARGVLLCGSGIGMSIAANKVDGVRAALVFDEKAARSSRAHNDANVLCLSADALDQGAIRAIVDAWLEEPFAGGRHQRRVDKVVAIECGKDPAGLPASEADARPGAGAEPRKKTAQ